MAEIRVETEETVWVDDETLAALGLAEEQYHRGEIVTLEEARANLQARHELWVQEQKELVDSRSDQNRPGSSRHNQGSGGRERRVGPGFEKGTRKTCPPYQYPKPGE